MPKIPNRRRYPHVEVAGYAKVLPRTLSRAEFQTVMKRKFPGISTVHLNRAFKDMATLYAIEQALRKDKDQ